MSFDSETARLIDRIQATAFYQAKLALINHRGQSYFYRMGRQEIVKVKTLGERQLGKEARGLFR